MFESSVTLAYANAPLSRSALTVSERGQLARLGSPERCLEWLRGRAALREVLVRRGEAPDTAVSFPHARYSISHAGPLAVAAGADARGVGVDFEAFRVMRGEAARFYLTLCECDWLATRPAAEHSDHMLRLWTVKEALFKADLRNAGRTLRDYGVLRPGDRAGLARTPTGTTQAYSTNRLTGGYLTVAITRGD